MLIEDLFKKLNIIMWKQNILYIYDKFYSYQLFDKNLIKLFNVSNKYGFKKYIIINFNGKFHNENGPAIACNCYINDYNNCHLHFYLNDLSYSPLAFSKETSHLICNFCRNFCKQRCFA